MKVFLQKSVKTLERQVIFIIDNTGLYNSLKVPENININIICLSLYSQEVIAEKILKIYQR